MAEGTRLLSEYGGKPPSRVRIPPSPLPPKLAPQAGSPTPRRPAAHPPTPPPKARLERELERRHRAQPRARPSEPPPPTLTCALTCTWSSSSSPRHPRARNTRPGSPTRAGPRHAHKSARPPTRQPGQAHVPLNPTPCARSTQRDGPSSRARVTLPDAPSRPSRVRRSLSSGPVYGSVLLLLHRHGTTIG